MLCYGLSFIFTLFIETQVPLYSISLCRTHSNVGMGGSWHSCWHWEAEGSDGDATEQGGPLLTGGRCHTGDRPGATFPPDFPREAEQHIGRCAFPIFRFCFKLDGEWRKSKLKKMGQQREENKIMKPKTMCLWTPHFLPALVSLLFSQVGKIHQEKTHTTGQYQVEEPRGLPSWASPLSPSS